MEDKQPKITLRLKPEQEVILQEVSDKLKVPKSVFIRAVIGDWLTKNEDCLYRLIDNKLHENEQDTEKTDIYSGIFGDDDE